MEWLHSVTAKLDLVNALAGFFLGLIPIIIPAITGYYKSIFSEQRKKYSGEFIIYHRSGTQPEIVRKKVITFSAGSSGAIDARMPKDLVTHLTYKGQLVPGTGGIIFCHLLADSSKEHIYIIAYEPITGIMHLSTGIMASVDMSGKPSAWRCILSRRELPLQQVENLLTNAPSLKIERPPFN